MTIEAEDMLRAALDPTLTLEECRHAPVLSAEVEAEVRERVREAVGQDDPSPSPRNRG
jgi:hypothetical protein